MRIVLALFYFVAGVYHFKFTPEFVRIVPAFVPWPEGVVLVTGVAEIAGAIGLFMPSLRQSAAIGLALYAVCVFPANINHALNHIDVAGLPNSWWYHGPRFVLQPVLVWWALYAGEIINWPFSAKNA